MSGDALRQLDQALAWLRNGGNSARAGRFLVHYEAIIREALTAPDAAPAAGGGDSLLRFVAEVMEDWYEGDLDGGTRQDLAVKHGLLLPTEVTAPCGEHCACEEYGDFPVNCYRPSDLLRKARAALQSTQHTEASHDR